MALDSSHRKLVLQNTPATLLITVSEDDQTKDPDSATIGIVNSAGDEIVASGTATVSGSPGDGELTYELAAQSDLENLTATWTIVDGGVTSVLEQHVEVLGEFYFTLLDLRNMSGLSDTGVFPLATLEEARMQAQDLVRKVTGVAWVPHFKRETHDGNGSTCLQLDEMFPREIKSISLDGVAQSLTDVEIYPDGEVYFPGGFPKDKRNVEIAYTYGQDRPPEDLRLAAKKYARQVVLGTNGRIPSRAVQMSTEAGQFNLTVAGKNRPTGDPEIDAILWQHDHRVPAVG